MTPQDPVQAALARIEHESPVHGPVLLKALREAWAAVARKDKVALELTEAVRIQMARAEKVEAAFRDEVIKRDQIEKQHLQFKCVERAERLEAENSRLREAFFIKCPGPDAIIRTNDHKTALQIAGSRGPACGHAHLIIVGDFDFALSPESKEAAK